MTTGHAARSRNRTQVTPAPSASRSARAGPEASSFLSLSFSGYLNAPELTAQVFDEIATFRVPRYVGFVTEWPMSGTKIKKVILREMIAADLKGKGHYPRHQDHHRALEGYIH